MNRILAPSSGIALALIVAAASAHGQAAWWEPEDPNAGDLITIYYDTDEGTLPPGPVQLHWGIDGWNLPPEEMWPPNTVPHGDGQSVNTQMIAEGENVWSVEIQTLPENEQLDFMFTNGNEWDNNNGADWHIYFGEPPVTTWHRFILDTRSAHLGYTVDEIDTAYVKGDFNAWSNAHPMNGPDERGVYWLDVELLAIPQPYKFSDGGDIWMQDPDNPLTDGGMFNNSLVIPEPKGQPYMYAVRPFEGQVFDPGEDVEVHAQLYPSDSTHAELTSVEFTVNNVVRPEVTFDVETGVLSGSLSGLSESQHTLAIEATDADGVTTTRVWYIAVHTQGEDGYLALDGDADDDGPGSYTAPAPDRAADLLQLSLAELAEGDSILFTLHLEYTAPETRAMVQIASNLNGQPVTTADFATEVALPEFDGSGVQIALADPSADFHDPAVHNRLITARDPAEYGAPVDMRGYGDGVIRFALGVADLEAVLGSYGSDWYYAIYTHYEGFDPTDGHSWEIGLANGGVAEDYDPDGFDALFMETSELQRTIFANNTENRTATLDNVGRGFAAIAPEQIGPNIGFGPGIRFITKDWTTVQDTMRLYCEVEAENIDVTLHHWWADDSTDYEISGVSGEFNFLATLEPGDNLFQLEAELEGEVGTSSVLAIFHKTPQAPVAQIDVYETGGTIYLDAQGSSDPQEQAIAFAWAEDADNPADVDLSGANSAVASFPVPDEYGEYYYDLTLEDTDGNVTHGRTFIAVREDGLDPFSLDESALWIWNAVVYEIFVRSYDDSESLDAITADSDRIAELDVKAIWLMPTQPGPSTHGYEITDYYGIEEDYGTHEDFAELVDAAHEHGLKVMMDLVINHSSIEHPWMQDAMALGVASNTYDWYDRDEDGDYTYYYDWVSLPNLNYSNPDLRDYMIEMSKWWIEQYEIDGYRCDVAWGVQERYPEFWPEWRVALKTIKPEAFLLAEADAGDFTFLTDRFDAAYDWNLHHEDQNSFEQLFTGAWPAGLQDVITNYGFPFPDYTFPFRFMENHDEPRYITYNTPQQTKTAATMLLTIPGVPLIYAGQEVGEESQRGLIQWDNDPYDMRTHYGKLLEARKRLQALIGDEQYWLDHDQGNRVYAYGRRWQGENPVVVALNLNNLQRPTNITFPYEEFGIEPDGDYYLNEILSDTHNEVTGSELSTIFADLDPYSSAVYVISDTLFQLDVPERAQVPGRWSLAQNYPNPFNPATRITFTLARPSQVTLAVYNVLGRRVATLVDSRMSAGRHVVDWNGLSDGGRALASGVYFYRIEAGEFVKSRKMVMLK